MNDKRSRYLLYMFGGIAGMFLWIFVALFLTGGREVENFTQTDKRVMTVFIVVEIATMVATLLFAGLYGRERGKQLRQQPVAANGWDKPTKNRAAFLWVASLVLAFAGQIGGVIFGKALSLQSRELCGWLMGGSICLAAVALLINVLLGKWYARRFDKQQICQVQQFVYAHREKAEQTAVQKLALLQECRAFSELYAVFLGCLGLCVALCSGVLYSSSSGTVLLFFAAFLMLSALSRVRFPVSQKVFEEERAYVTQQQYPRLYAVAQRAARTVGCEGQIRIALMPDFNAGIAKVGKVYSVQLGVIFLCTLSEEELYCILLHEFAHVTEKHRAALRERDYGIWLREGKTPHYASGLTNLLFAFLDEFYLQQFSLYDYAASIQTESAADREMLLSENPEAIASALLKLKYYELFNWEKGTRDESCIYEPETAEEHVLKKELEVFLQAVEKRSEDWNALLPVEIQSRAASHPTLQLRLAALGIREVRYIPAPESDYAEECAAAMDSVDELLYKDMAEQYADYRKTYYLEPKELVEQWENDGKPLAAETYGDLVWSLRQLGRYTEAIDLCQRAIAELSEAASAGGYFIRGCHRLHCYDPAGIQDIYLAIACNSNYLQEGIAAIGTFCCLTGNQRELDIYREKGVELAQLHKDQYSGTEVLTKKDRLTEENLPEGMLENILSYIHSIENGEIEKIYLVRKVIQEDFFTSVFVVRFALDADEDACGKILHKIFRYLDTCSDWQFSLFDYQDVMDVPVWSIENSCVYTKDSK